MTALLEEHVHVGTRQVSPHNNCWVGREGLGCIVYFDHILTMPETGCLREPCWFSSLLSLIADVKVIFVGDG